MSSSMTTRSGKTVQQTNLQFMPTVERCWSCDEFKPGVRLRANGDRMCKRCDDENERKVQEILRQKASGSGTVDNNNVTPSTSHQPVPTNSKSNTPASAPASVTRFQPVSNTNCTQCLKPCKNGIVCAVCDGQYHQNCSNIPAVIFDKFAKIIKSIGWVCTPCRKSARSVIAKSQSAIADLTQQVAEIKHAVNELQSAQVTSAPVNNEPPTSAASSPPSENEAQAQPTLVMIHRTLQDNERRRRNVVISGLDEEGDDKTVVTELCEQYFTMKPLITDKDCIRLGQPRLDRPRRLLVRFRSEDTAQTVLRNARKLRASTDSHVSQSVFINPDLSREAAQAAYERRQQRRNRQTSQAVDTHTSNGATTQQDDHPDVRAQQPAASDDVLNCESTEGRPACKD